ncbi:hypothetical protein KIL84_008000 [Mauremys mutica]|uniref:Uncharacterized protein n=1 Tax=Mauremys mutica TaxID=74926 RepID=A0A9D3X406_9SAUR|nr:hypothetical protein KIL84_008000 [Mauremys mutica]
MVHFKKEGPKLCDQIQTCIQNLIITVTLLSINHSLQTALVPTLSPYLPLFPLCQEGRISLLDWSSLQLRLLAAAGCKLQLFCEMRRRNYLDNTSAAVVRTMSLPAGTVE